MEEQAGFNMATQFHTAVRVVTSPAAFFREMPKTGGFRDPLQFLLVMGVVVGALTAVLGLAELTFVLSGGMAVAALVITPVFYAAFGFIGAAIVFIIWRLLGSQESYEASFRCVAHVAAFMPIVTLINLVPYAGVPAGIALVVWVYVIASVETHHLPAGKAWLVFGIIGGGLFLLSLGAGMASRTMQQDTDQKIREMHRSTEEMKKAIEELQKRIEQEKK